MKFDEFGILNGAATKVVKKNLKKDKDLDKICFEEVLGKDINWFSVTQITTIKTLKDPFYKKCLPNLQNTHKWIKFEFLDKILRL